MKGVNRNNLIGYAAGIISGMTYGLNPLFAMPLINNGASVEAILFFRYALSALILLSLLLIGKQNLGVNMKQGGILIILGLLFTASSTFLFEAYKYIASGLATTLIFLFPIFVALIMMFLRVFPTWQVWLSVAICFAGVVIMTQTDSSQAIAIEGVLLSLGSALAYAIFIVIINHNKTIRNISNSLITFYAMIVGSVVFLTRIILNGHTITTGIDSEMAWLNLVGLAILPTIVSTSTLAISTRKIGATKASVLSVFEPITAIMAGSLALNEPITTNIIIGITLSISAVTFMILSAKK
ncbi:MAG: DMT family transporter [Bacteroidaceae bacterium]|nr:DMT family transporter [Bacteroidaceae bacterium]